MKQITRYICEKCGKHFDNYEDAYQCENAHLMPDTTEMKVLEDYAVYAEGRKFPDQIVLPFIDNDEVKCFVYNRGGEDAEAALEYSNAMEVTRSWLEKYLKDKGLA